MEPTSCLLYTSGKEFVAIYEEITGEKLKRSGEEKQKEEVKELPQNEEE